MARLPAYFELNIGIVVWSDLLNLFAVNFHFCPTIINRQLWKLSSDGFSPILAELIDELVDFLRWFEKEIQISFHREFNSLTVFLASKGKMVQPKILLRL